MMPIVEVNVKRRRRIGAIIVPCPCDLVRDFTMPVFRLHMVMCPPQFGGWRVSVARVCEAQD